MKFRMLVCSYARHIVISAAALSACAQASAPPGGTPDTDPPRVIKTVPEQGAVVPDFTGPVHIKFDETLSERGPRKNEMVSVSPDTGTAEVSRSGDELKI